jgi:glycosyltransferase involved in cell wall biosynthesis
MGDNTKSFDRLRSMRSITPEQSESAPVLLTVFVGTFNAEAHLPNLFKSLKSQAWSSDVQLIIADNASNDETLEALRAWKPPKDLSSYTLVENFNNLGALGSLYLNLDLVNGEWLTFIHQDDLYEANYIQVALQSAIDADATSTSTISFDYLTKEDEKRPRYLANPTWFADGQVDSKKFLQNLANHSIPWPCTIFRATYFQGPLVPFHSSAFLDTELALINVPMGSNQYRTERLLSYRVHAASGSHSLLSQESDGARFASMMRVFHSKSFTEVLDALPNELATGWLQSVISAAQSYFAEERLRELLELVILEAAILIKEYQIQEMNDLLSNVYMRMGGVQPAQILSNMGSKPLKSRARLSPETVKWRKSQSFQIPDWLRLILGGPLFKILMRVSPKWLIPKPWKYFK